MASSNRRFAVHVDVTGYKNIDKHEVVRVQAVTFGSDQKQEEYSQIFLPTVSIAKDQSAVHGLTKKMLKKSHAPIFNAQLGAKFVEFTKNGRGFSDAPWKIHILNNELRANGLPPLPKLTYTYTLYKELHPERSKGHEQGQHTIEMIESLYPVGNLKGAYKIAAVQLKMEAEKCAKEERAAKSIESNVSSPQALIVEPEPIQIESEDVLSPKLAINKQSQVVEKVSSEALVKMNLFSSQKRNTESPLPLLHSDAFNAEVLTGERENSFSTKI